MTRYALRFSPRLLGTLFALCTILSTAGLSRAQSWSLLTPTAPLPVARDNAFAAYSSASNRLILFGGYPHVTGYTNDLWILKDANGLGTPTWMPVFANGASGSPPPRATGTMAYDAINNRAILVGGESTSPGVLLDDVWVLNNADGTTGSPVWTQLSPQGSLPGRENHGAIYDPQSNRLVVFMGVRIGGCRSGDQCVYDPADVWILTNANGLGGTPVWSQLLATGTPPGRLTNSLDQAYDPASNRLMVFGGWRVLDPAFPGTVLNDVWVLTNANGLGGPSTWTQLSPTGPPPAPRSGASGFYDKATNRLIIFSGSNLGVSGPLVNFSDVWELDNANGLGGTPAWHQLNPTGLAITPHVVSNGLYDSARNRMILFGGNVNGFVANETWVLSVANGIAASQLRIDAVQPSHGGQGAVTAQVVGGGFQPGATVRLTGLGSDIIGMNTTVSNLSMLTTTFDLTAAVAGPRDVVVANPDGTSASLASGFTVEQGGAPDVWVDILGRSRIRIGSEQSFYLTYGNSGNLDWNGLAFVSIKVPQGIDPVTVSLGGKVVGQFHPQPISTLPLVGSNPGNQALVSTFVLPSIPASGENTPYTIQFTAPASFLGSMIDLEIDPFEVPTALNPPVTLLPIQNQVGQYISSLIDLKAHELGIEPPPLGDLFFEAFKQALADALKDQLTELLVNTSLSTFPDYIKKAVADALNRLRSTFDAAVQAYTDYWNNIIGAQSGSFFDSALYANYQAATPPFPGYKLPNLHTPLEAVGSSDPNEKVGSNGHGSQRYSVAAKPLQYAIFFSNEQTASASAQNVVITDQLDIIHDDLTTFSLGLIAIPAHTVSPPSGLTDYTTMIDLRPSNNLLVNVNAHLDLSTGLLTWRFTSLDPSTNQSPTDPAAGFLPPGEEGSVFFTVSPKQGLPTDTQIQNQAAIVFDVNAPMFTQTWLNTLDNTPPTSHMVTLPPTENSTSFPVQWTGTDIGAGIQDFTIYVSIDGGTAAVFLTNTTATSATFTGQSGHTYAFYSIARDLVGNVEAAKTVAEATTQVTADTTPPVTTAVVSPAHNAAGWNNSNVMITLNSRDNEPGGTGVKQIKWSLSGAQTGSSTVSGSTTTVTISTEGTTTLTYFGTDNAGNIETAKTVTINIDKTPPAITASANPATLWPPNGKLVNVTISGTMADNLSGVNASTAAFAVQDSYGLVQPSGPVSVGPNGAYSFTVLLEARRNGQDQAGRLYTIAVSAQDNAGNANSATTTVTVPHDQGN
jgi:galactose oxidase-like protein